MVKKLTPEEKQDLKKLSCIVNTYFFYCEAIDLLLREADYSMRLKNRGLTHEIKHRHKIVLEKMVPLRNALDSYFNFYIGAFTDEEGVFNYKKMDDVRNSGNFFARLGIEIVDRTANSKKGELENKIEQYILNMPTTGILEEYHLERLKLR